jgi:peptide/nickel transport system substrate-binding protein
MRRFLIAFAAATALVAATPGLAADRYIHANNSPYDTLDPHNASNDVARVAPRLNLYDGLYRWVDNPPQLIPWLALSHTVSADGLVWTFKLRNDVKFHDGTLMKADDVVYSMERTLEMKRGGPSALFLPIVAPGSTKALNPTTVQFTLKEPSAVFGSFMADLYVVNSALLKKHEVKGDWGADWLIKNEAGSGSYVLSRYDPAVGFVAKRFADHFAGWGKKYFDEIEFRTVIETNTRIQGLIRGDYHGLDGYLAPDQVDRLEASKGVKIIPQESMRVFTIAMHNARPPFDDINFRKAMSYAFDYEGYIKSIMKGTVARNPTIVPNNMWGAPKDIKGYTYDLDKAKEYLAKVKGPIRTVRIGALSGFSETEQAASLMQNALSKLGIESKIESSPWPVIATKMQDPETMFDMLPYWKSTYYADPNNWIGELYGSRYAPTRNVSSYKNPEVDKKLEEAIRTTDKARRQTLYEEAGRIVYNEAAGIWIYNTKWFGPYASKVEGIRFCPVGNGQDMRWAYFKD